MRVVEARAAVVLERDTQLASLVEYADEAATGTGRLVLVAGEAGVGKSTLLDRLRVVRPDGRWFVGACDGLSTPRPLGPVQDIAEQLGGELADQLAVGVPPAELFATVLRMLDGPGGLTVLVVEDLHYADEATLDLLRFLGRRLAGTHALVLATYRDEALAGDAALTIALGHLATQRSTRRVDVPPLTAGGVAELAHGTGLDPAELYRLTGGNAFFVTELLRADGGALPSSARDAVLASVARLSAPARSTVESAALAGPRVHPEVLGTDADLLGAGRARRRRAAGRRRHAPAVPARDRTARRGARDRAAPAHGDPRGSCSTGSSRPGAATTRGWRTTRRAPATRRRSCGTPRSPRARPRRLRHTGRRSLSCSARSGSPTPPTLGCGQSCPTS